MSSSKDSVKNVLTVSTLLCVACSVVVSVVAVGLRDQQELNATLDKKRNVLLAAGLIDETYDGKLEPMFADIEAVRIDLATGRRTDGDVENFDMKVASADPAGVVPITPEQYPLGIKRRPREVVVFLHKPEGKLKTVILPVVAQGLWSTMYGFLALAPDLKTTRGLVFYEQGETPGLGGEVDNPLWRNQFRGEKKLFDADGDYDFEIVKPGRVKDPVHEAEGISGATITVRGVDGMLGYWMSDAAYGPFLERLKADPSGGI